MRIRIKTYRKSGTQITTVEHSHTFSSLEFIYFSMNSESAQKSRSEPKFVLPQPKFFKFRIYTTVSIKMHTLLSANLNDPDEIIMIFTHY